jgi:hypothetical protein
VSVYTGSASLQRLCRNHSCVAQVVESLAKQPRSGDFGLSPARKRRVKWEIYPSRVAATPLATQSLQARVKRKKKDRLSC